MSRIWIVFLDPSFLSFFLPQFFPHSLTLVRLGSLHNKSLFVMTVNHEPNPIKFGPIIFVVVAFFYSIISGTVTFFNWWVPKLFDALNYVPDRYDLNVKVQLNFTYKEILKLRIVNRLKEPIEVILTEPLSWASQ